MPWQSASKIELSEKQEKILKEFANGSHTPEHLKKRSKAVLSAAEGQTNNSIERNLKMTPDSVKRWRDRYSQQHEELNRTEAETAYWQQLISPARNRTT